MKKNVMYKAVCECGWDSGYHDSIQSVQKALKAHNDNDAHRDFVDVPVF